MTSMEASSSSTTRPPQERPSADYSDDGQKKNGSGPSSGLIPSPDTVLPNEADRGDGRIHGNQQEPYDGTQEEVLDDDSDSLHGSGPSSPLIRSTSSPDIGPGTVLPDEAHPGDRRIHGNHQGTFDGIQEEVLVHDDYSRIHRNQQEHVLIHYCVLGFGYSLFALVLLILVYVIQREKPEITMKSITFDSYNVSTGSDSSGLETYTASVNSTVIFTYRNNATFFGVHVTSITLKLDYLLLTLANGTAEYFYQSKKSQRTVAVVVSGNQIPMYASGASFNSYASEASFISYASGASFISYVVTLTPVPLKLSFAVSSKAYILSLLEAHYKENIYCLVIFDPKKLKVPLSLHNCIYN